MQTLIIDNGGSDVKIGLSHDRARVVPNAIFKSRSDKTRTYVSTEIAELLDRSSLFYSRPLQRGYLMNIETQQRIWRVLFDNIDPVETRVIVSDLNCVIPAVDDAAMQILFEEFGFAAVNKSSPAQWIGNALMPENSASLIVDCGFSGCNVVPLFEGQILQRGVRRLELGGMHLTNQLKQWITYRQMKVLEETWTMEECKQECCFVSLDFNNDMQKASMPLNDNNIVCDYVLPDFRNKFKGYSLQFGMPRIDPIDEQLQTIRMLTERFQVPEILFRPQDIGMCCMGIGECVAEAVTSLHPLFAVNLLQNICVVGGSSKFPNFKERLFNEIRMNIDRFIEVEFSKIEDPVLYPWDCAASLVSRNQVPGGFITREEYDEMGDFRINEKFLLFYPDETFSAKVSNMYPVQSSKEQHLKAPADGVKTEK